MVCSNCTHLKKEEKEIQKIESFREERELLIEEKIGWRMILNILKN